MQCDPMQAALAAAREAFKADEVPVGAVIVDPARSEIIARATNAMRGGKDPTAHAEILAIRMAAAANGGRLDGYDLYVTMEPCAMCAGAIEHARIRRLYFGTPDPRGGAVENGIRYFTSQGCRHAPDVYGGFLEQECAELLHTFFAARRG